MGFWKCNDGTKVELIFDDQGNFVKFGDDVNEVDAKKAENEIHNWKSAILSSMTGSELDAI